VSVDGHLERVTEFVDANNYAEHSPLLEDGVSVLRSALEVEDEGRRRIDYQRVHRVLAQENFVLCVSEGNYGGVHTAYYDLFRLEKGKSGGALGHYRKNQPAQRVEKR